jgi:RNA-directed DNA polymerase
VKNSKDSRRQQTTSYEGWPKKVGVEPREESGALSNPAASSGRGNETQSDGQALMERIVAKDNMTAAFKRVTSNRGSHGVDGMQVDELRTHLWAEWPNYRQQLLEGAYQPQPVRRVEIPKPSGGTRQLGIPTVMDRLIQQAAAQVLTLIFDPGFSGASYGFRPKKSAHDAIRAACRHIEDGHGTVVDMDLEKFFDRVNHDKLMSLVARKVDDKRVLRLIRRYLEAGALENGVRVRNERGTPQGGPLSPLLANILLDELDKELERRGHRYCRYADDFQVYVKSRKAGYRVMDSVTRYLGEELKLKVNREKSTVGSVYRSKFLGFSFRRVPKTREIRARVHAKSYARFKEKVRACTSRNKAKSMEERRDKLNALIRGWTGYFRLADMKNPAMQMDEWIRRRIRMCWWKQWKKIRTKHDNLVRLGVGNAQAWQYANTRKSYWRTAGSPILGTSLTNRYLKEFGFMTLTECLSMK